jgi:hypothetical protein
MSKPDGNGEDDSGGIEVKIGGIDVHVKVGGDGVQEDERE